MSSKISSNAKQKDYSKYPFMNLSLVDIPGEEWVSIPGFDDYFYVSQYGRIWALDRPVYAIDGHFYYIKQRIRKQNLSKVYNSFTKDYTEQLSLHIRYEGKNHGFVVNRLVYEAFISPINNKGKKPFVVHKDGDNCNNHYKNLILMNGTQLYRHLLEIKRKPRIGPSQKKVERIVWNDSNSPKPIVRYSLDGKKVNEYESIGDAAKKIGSTRGVIRQVLTKKLKQLKGFVYRFKGEKYNGEYADFSRGKKVIQYSIEGKKISIFPSVAEGALKTGIDGATISKCALGKAKLAGGYVWRYQHDNYRGEYQGTIRGPKSIIQYSLDGKIVARFPAINQAAKKTGFTASTIQDCVKRKTKISHGYVWRYEHEKYNGEHKNYRQGKPVTQYNLKGKKIQTFPTIEEGARITGLTSANIQKNVKEENKTAGGFVWRYATKREIKTLPAFKRPDYKSNIVSKVIVKYAVDGKKLATYSSITQAAKASGVSSHSISIALDANGRTSAGFVWRSKGNRYYGELVKHPALNKARTVTQYDLKGKRINQFKSTKDAGRKTGVNSTTISAVAKGKLKTTGGFIWQYGDGPAKLDLKTYFNSTKEALERASKPVIKCTLEGELITEYPSIAAAARKEGISKNGISKVLIGKQQSCGGYFWKLKV
jgi:hypothetical protein